MALRTYHGLSLTPPLTDEERGAAPWFLVHNGAALGEVESTCPEGTTQIIVGDRRHCVAPCLPGFERRVSPTGLPACVKPAVSWVFPFAAGVLAVVVLRKPR